jgi:photosystem II stability/assembly factor-like uncharacterized protein
VLVGAGANLKLPTKAAIPALGEKSGALAPPKISFSTPLIGYVATQGGASDHVTIKTIDGGLTWSELPVVTTESGFSGSGFVSPTLGWIGGETGAFETADGGSIWQKVAWAGAESINRFRIFSDGSAIAVGKHVFRYTPPN